MSKKMKWKMFDFGAAVIIGVITFLMLVGLSYIEPIAAKRDQPEISAQEYVDRWDEV